MATFRRPSRASDRNLGYVAGEQMRPARPSEGPHAGYTLVTANGHQAQRILKRDGWVEVDATGPVEVTAPEVAEGPLTLLGVIATGTLAELEGYLAERSLIVLTSQEELAGAIEAEKAGRNRKGALKLMGAYVLAVPAPSAPSGDVAIWIPEAPGHSNVYAMNDKGEYTTGWEAALHFDTEADCQAWCDAHPEPKYVPVCHGYFQNPMPDAPTRTGLGVEEAGSVLMQPAIGRSVQRPKL